MSHSGQPVRIARGPEASAKRSLRCYIPVNARRRSADSTIVTVAQRYRHMDDRESAGVAKLSSEVGGRSDCANKLPQNLNKF